ncbi:ADL052Wp [Eremothecium gossypii ATCC 10895]|nr:ADL052Wp [Eremothecium gossypii ATCC 10895]AAS51868.1 ADL052Wp [Eremothecium gossypii ATCC 10895]AEY96165.1 FADL052Wp [Eremothecium gossypii FDAG1]
MFGPVEVLRKAVQCRGMCGARSDGEKFEARRAATTSPRDTAMAFEIDGKCLCYHGPLLYEARVLRVYDPASQTYRDRTRTGVPLEEEDGLPAESRGREHWFVHYQGWKSTWDEWVGQERIRPYNDENLALKRQLVQDAKAAAAAAKRAKARPGKRERSPAPAAPAAPAQGPRLAVRMPVELKALLVDDWERITKERKLVALPCAPTVGDILDAYYRERTAQLASPVAQTLLHEFVEGVHLYFDQCLSHLLLYRLERLQFDEACGGAAPAASGLPAPPEPRPSAVYGGVHLLRLLSMMPELICGTTMDEKSCHTVVAQCESLLAWMATHADDLVSGDYINTSAQYEGVALGM